MATHLKNVLLIFILALGARSATAQSDSTTRYIEGGLLTGSALPQVKLYNSYRQGGFTLAYGKYRNKWALELQQSFIVLGSGNKFIDHYSRWLMEVQLRRIKITKWNFQLGAGIAYSRYHISFLPFADSKGNILVDPDERKVEFSPLSFNLSLAKPLNERLSLRLTFNTEPHAIFRYSYFRYNALWLEVRYAILKRKSRRVLSYFE